MNPKTKLIIVIGSIVIILFPLAYFISRSDISFEPEFIKQCIKHENKTHYTQPINVCVMQGEYGCSVWMPVGGGQPYEKEVCTEYQQINNPKWKK